MISLSNRSHKKNVFIFLLFIYLPIVNFCANCMHPYQITTVYVFWFAKVSAVIRPDSYRISLVCIYLYTYIYYTYIYTLLFNINRLPRYTQYPISGGIIKRSIKDSIFFFFLSTVKIGVLFSKTYAITLSGRTNSILGG